MSRLQIPRKQNMTGAVTSSMSTSGNGPQGNPHLEKALLENFLAIERWANAQITAVAIAHSTTHAMAVPTDNPVLGPWTTLWDSYSLADTANNRLRMPEAGVYFVAINATAENFFATTANLLQNFNLAMVGESTHIIPQVAGSGDYGVTYASTSGTAISGAPSVNFCLPVLVTGASWVHDQASTLSTACTYRLLNFSAIRVGNIPSKNQ